MRLRSLAAVAAFGLTIAALTIPAGAEDAPTDIRQGPIVLTSQDLPKGITDFAEPSIVVTREQTVLICGPGGLTGGQNHIVRSEDWTSFQPVGYSDPGGGGDCELELGPDNAVYGANLQGFGSAIRKSVDDGATWEYQTTEDAVEQDRQWLAADPVDGSVVYLAYHDLVAELEVVAKSLDGGKTFPIHTVVSSDPRFWADSYPNTYSGPIQTDPTDHNRLYVVYAISTLEENVQPEYAPWGPPDQIIVARSDDGGITWSNTMAMSTPPGGILGNLFPWIAIDRAGNVYVAAAGRLPKEGGGYQNGMYLAVSTDRAGTFTDPIKVNQGDGATVFPTVVAGNDGLIDLTWIESDDTDQDAAATWTVHFAQSRNATSEAPTFEEVT
ncbi:MAG TPA: sialidase family protein, partial [Actinomycetota bacterium]|nr:sialidase family protein [Actinomycetota bacterium]